MPKTLIIDIQNWLQKRQILSIPGMSHKPRDFYFSIFNYDPLLPDIVSLLILQKHPLFYEIESTVKHLAFSICMGDLEEADVKTIFNPLDKLIQKEFTNYPWVGITKITVTLDFFNINNIIPIEQYLKNH